MGLAVSADIRKPVAMFVGDLILARLHGFPVGGTLLGDIAWTIVLSATYRRPAAARLDSHPLWVPVPTKELAVV